MKNHMQRMTILLLALLYASTLAVAEVESERTFHCTGDVFRQVGLSWQMTAKGPEEQPVTVKDSWQKRIDSALWRIEFDDHTAPKSGSAVSLSRSDLLLGGLLLVNKEHPLPADFSDKTLASVSQMSNNAIQVADDHVSLFPNAFFALSSLIAAADQQGLGDYFVEEGYRSNDRQTELFNNMKEKLSSEYSGDRLIEETKKYVNDPGTSEYQTGMSFRMRLYNAANEEISRMFFHASEQGKWFAENSWKYGIIFRFPTADFPLPGWEDKSHITGMTIQLNLYRYVGKAHAAAMCITGYCLEEYVEFLKNHPHIYIYQDGKLRYEVYRMEMEDAGTYEDLPIPSTAEEYLASVDNTGGVVLAYSYNP